MDESPCSAPDLRVFARGLLVAYLTLVPVVFWYGLIEPFEACKSTLTQLTGLALVVLALSAAHGRSWAWTWARLRGSFSGPVGVAVSCTVLSALASTVFSLSPRTSLRGALDSNTGLGSVLALAALFAASRALCAEKDTAQQVLGAATVGLALSCTYALVQALGSDPVRWAQVWVYRGWLRPGGTQGHPNYLAGFAAMVLPIVLWHIRGAVERRQTTQAVAGVLLALGAAFVVTISLSRGALLAGALAVLVLLAGWRTGVPRRRTAAYLLGSLGLCLLTFFCFDNRLKPVLVERVREHVASPGRWPIWQGAVRLFLDHPWTGSGLDTFGLAWPGVRTPEYWDVEWGFMPVKAHNDFLHALATQGAVGAAAYAMLPLALLWSLARAWRQGRQRGWVAVLASIAVAFFVQNLVGFAVASTAGLLAVVAGMVAGLRDQPHGSETPDSPVSRPPVLPPATWVGAFLVLATLWQGGGGHAPWRLALVALALFWGAMVALAAYPADAGPGFPRKSIRPSFPACRGVVLPGLGGLVAAWFLLCPLVGSGLSFRAEVAMHRDPNGGISYHARAVRWDPQNALLHERRARALWQAAVKQPAMSRRRDLLVAAQESVETACRLEPWSASFHANRARILLELAQEGLVQPGEVLAAFDRALDLDRCDWFVVADAAGAAVTLGHLEKGEGYLERGLCEQPQLGMLLAQRGALELARGQLARAEQSLREALDRKWFGERERFDHGQLLLGTVLLQSGRAGEAESLARGVLDRHHDWPPARMLYAHSREQLGQKEEARGGLRPPLPPFRPDQ